MKDKMIYTYGIQYFVHRNSKEISQIYSKISPFPSLYFQREKKTSSKVLLPGHDISSPATDPSSPLYQGKDAMLGVFFVALVLG